MREEHLGSDFDDFLSEEGLLGHCEAVAIKRTIAFQISELMQEQNLSRTEMARRMNTTRATLARLLDPSTGSVALQTLERAALALGKRLRVQIV